MKELTAIEKQLQKSYGDIFLDKDALQEIRGDFTSVSLSMDIALHGGFLDGTIMSISGVTGAGKTTLCLNIIANAQKRGKMCYYIDVEGRLQVELIATIAGLDIDASKLKIIRSTSDKFLTAEDYFNIITSLLNQPNILIVLDSVAILCGEAGMGAQFGESKKMMNIPAMMYDLMRKAAQVLPVMKSNLVLITHIQANPSPYGAGFAEVGGNAMKFEASYRIQCLSSSEFPKEGKKLGRESKFKILKCATGPGTGEAVFYIKYYHGYDQGRDIVNLAEELGMINKSGSWYDFKNSKGEVVKLQGQENVIDWLNQNPDESEYYKKLIKDMFAPKQVVEETKKKAGKSK